MNDTPSATRGDSVRSRRFAFGLLAWLVLTVLTFRVVSRYMIRIAALYDYDIENAAVQFGLYFVLCALMAGVVDAGLRRAPVAITRENQLRLMFLLAVTVSTIFAIYQGRFGPEKLINYSAVGALGAFAAALAVTWREYRIIEVIARPPERVVAEVFEAHAGVVVAASLWDRVKRGLEIVLSLTAIVVSLPISIPLAIAVWLQDPGPLLVAKVAVMRAGRSFNQLKLRSMIKNAESNTGPVPAAPDDGRVTRFGRLLRRTHIDELPQMFNILRGEMSFVGPRPERTVFVHRHLESIPGYTRRHAVRPGLAGMAQVYGDYYSTPKEKLRYDLLYIRRRSLGLDLKLFSAAVLIALLGVRPDRRHQRRHVEQRRDERQRWRRAYRALRGDAAPEARPGADHPPAPEAGPDAHTPPPRTKE